LNNLKNNKSILSQTATLLIVIITIILVFALIVANIGNLSVQTTVIDNAADAASLYLASQLATQSYQLSKSLEESCGDSKACCVKTGLASSVLAIVFALVAVVAVVVIPGAIGGIVGLLGISGPYAGMAVTTIVGATAGMMGGAIGGAIAGTGVLQGAIQGMMIGAAIGSSIGGSLYGGAGLGNLLGLSGNPVTAVEDVGVVLLPGAHFGLGPVILTTPTAGALGAAISVTLNIASRLYSSMVKDQMTKEAMDAIVKAMSKLKPQRRMRESTFFQALTNIVDDPNKVPDETDSDGDGDTTELVPNFQVCWDKRVKWFINFEKPDLSAAREEIKKFLGRGYGPSVSPVKKFLKETRQFVKLIKKQKKPAHPYFGRQEVEGFDGTGTAFLRTLEGFGYDVRFWEPGPSKDVLNAWKKNWYGLRCGMNCQPSNPPSGYDELDYLIDELKDFNFFMKRLRQAKMRELIYGWRLWVGWFYQEDKANIGLSSDDQTEIAEDAQPDPDDPDEIQPASSPTGGVLNDYYHAFERTINGDNSSYPPRLGLRGWQAEVERIRLKLPECIYGGEYYDPMTGTYIPCVENMGCSCIINPPCRDGNCMGFGFGTIDGNFDDEFQEFKNRIENFIGKIEEFRQACKDFYYKIKDLMAEVEAQIPTFECGITGTNPVFYMWNDTRCGNSTDRCHTVEVWIRPFNLPELVHRSYGNWFSGKECIELENYDQVIKVRIKRWDPQAPIGHRGMLGIWNPLGGEIVRVSKARYVGLADKGVVKIKNVFLKKGDIGP